MLHPDPNTDVLTFFVLCSLHRLTVDFRIRFKILIFTYRALNLAQTTTQFLIKHTASHLLKIH